MNRRDALKVIAATPLLVTTVGETALQGPDRPVRAAIISTDLDGALVREMTDAARAAGFTGVITLRDLPSLEATGDGDAREYHLPKKLADVRLIILDEWIGGRSAFEAITILKKSVKSKDLALFMLATAPRDSTLFAAWAAGVDCFLTKPFDIAEFRGLCGTLRQKAATGKRA